MKKEERLWELWEAWEYAAKIDSLIATSLEEMRQVCKKHNMSASETNLVLIASNILLHEIVVDAIDNMMDEAKAWNRTKKPN